MKKEKNRIMGKAENILTINESTNKITMSKNK